MNLDALITQNSTAVFGVLVLAGVVGILKLLHSFRSETSRMVLTSEEYRADRAALASEFKQALASAQAEIVREVGYMIGEATAKQKTRIEALAAVVEERTGRAVPRPQDSGNMPKESRP